jgi:hypothetical protein
MEPQHQHEWADDQGPVLTAREFALFSQLTRRLPARWLATRRNRRLLFLALAAPGFFAVFGTIYHHTFWLMVVGFFLFGAAVLFRSRTEPLFERAEAADLWPSPELASVSEDTTHA